MLDYLYKPKATIRVKYNMRKRQKQNKNKFFESKIALGITISGFFLLFAIWIGTLIELINGGKRTLDKQNLPWIFAVITITLIVYVLYSLIQVEHNNFYVYELSPKGIKRSLFKRYRIIEIDWDEVYEIRCYEEPNGILFMFRKFNSVWLIISKVDVGEITLKQAYKRKDTFCIYIDHIKYINRIREYTDKEIIDLPPRLQNTDKT